MSEIFDFLKTPEGQGLLSAAFTGLATAQRGAPLNSIGKAGMGGLLGYSNAQNRITDMADKEAMRKMQQAQHDLALQNYELNVKKLGMPDYKVVGNEVVQFGQDGVKPVYTAPADPNKMSRKDELEYMSQLRRDEREFAAKLAAGNKPAAQPYFQFIATPNGIVKADARSGNMAYGDINGAPVVKSADSPQLQGAITGAKESAKDQVEATAQLPKAIANGEEALRQSNELLKHPGFKQAVGGSSLLGIQKIPGTDAKDFMNRLDQIKGGAFLTAFETLKGGGQITEVEGKKATDAIARMDNATSEGEFVKAVQDYQNVIKKAVNNAKMRAGKNQSSQQAPAQGAKFLGFE